MSKSELEGLERDVEEARARLSADLTRLSSPQVFSGFKAGVSRDLDQLKQQAIDTTKEVARERAQDIVEMVTDRIAANPAAAAAIGAGLAWRLFRHPPVSTALIGLGLYGLLRSNGNGSGPMPRPRRNGATGRLDKKSGIDWNRKAEVFADNARGQLSDAAEAVRDRASDAADLVRGKVSDAVGVVRENAADAAETVREGMSDAIAATRGQAEQATNAARETVANVTGAATARASALASEAGEFGRRTASTAKEKTAAWTESGRRKVSHIVEETSPRDAVLLGAAAVAIVTAIGLAAQRTRD